MFIKRILIIIFLLFLMISISYPQIVFVNEIMSSNSRTIADEDGDFPDWFELYNASNQIMDLTGFSISDDPTKLDKWIFPEVILHPFKHLLVFASGKDKRNWINHWETIITWGDEWKYRIGDLEPPVSWSWVGFDDSHWNVGVSGFGYGDNDDNTVVPQTTSIFIRKSFHIKSIENIVLAIFHIDYDDAFVAYINGDEIARANIGEPGFIPPFDHLADNSHEAVLFQGGEPETFQIENIQKLLQPGENVLAVQVHNRNVNSSDLTAIPFLTLGMKEPPENPNGVSPDINIVEGSLHTNFKLKSEGEQLYLSNAAKEIMDQVSFGVIPPNVSFGRIQDGATNWGYFKSPTPWDSNIGNSFQGILEKPVFSLQPGFYAGSVQVEFLSSEPDVQIYYTLDNAEPDKNSNYFTAPIEITHTTVIRACAFKNGMLSSEITTGTFFIDETPHLPVISLSTSTENLWDENSGIYVLGPNAESDFPHFGANFWQDWERPIHLEFFETNGNLEFHQNAGMKIFGGWSRGFNQKSLAIYARGEYGAKTIEYPLFPEKPISKFQTIVLRNSGNDWNYSMIRDAFMQGLVKNTNLVTQAYRPVVVFLNGLYWGIHNVREKINEHYIAANYDVDQDNIDFLEFDDVVIQGDERHYHDMLDFFQNNDLSIPANYEYIKTLMDIDNFIDYQVTQIYLDNKDWPGNNIKFWRSRTNSGKWRWLPYDTDFGYGLYYPEAYKNNTLEFATDPNGPEWPNPPWSTFLIRSLLKNKDFEHLFINRFSDLLNTIFLPHVVHDQIVELRNGIIQEMPRHSHRWQLDYDHWLNEMNVLRDFATFRSSYVRAHIIQKFNLSGTARLTLNVNPDNSGKIKISTLNISNFPWEGQYFKGIPIRLTALPNTGYQFSGWEGKASDNQSFDLLLNQDYSITANFSPAPIFSDQIIINEINYSSIPDFNTEDWIELYNDGENSIDLSYWVLKDSEDDHRFIFPQQVILDPEDYLVVCRDTSAFKTYFPTLKNSIGNLNFGLSPNGDAIRLYDSSANLVDSLFYGVQSPWPSEANGAGYTLILTDPNLDNSKAGSWAAATGTPGQKNDVGANTGKNDGGKLLPTSFQVQQNYPNPFNRETIIRFKIPQTGLIRGEVYNATGKIIEKIFEKEFSAGFHQIIWQPSEDVPSGIYFVKMAMQQHASVSMKILFIK